MILAVLFSMLAALSFGASTVMQHRVAADLPTNAGLGFGLLGALITRPMWVAGALAGAVGLACHAAALGLGQLAVVQPLLVTGMLFALLGSMAVGGPRLTAGEWLSAGLVVAGLGLFLLAARPAHGTSRASSGTLAAAALVLVVLAVATIAAAEGPGRRHRAGLLGLASGTLYGVTAALLKQVAAIVAADGSGVVRSWPLYGLLVVGTVALVITQRAYQAGRLSSSLPAMTVSDPLVSVVLGAYVFGEGLAGSPLAHLGQAAGFVLLAFGVTRVAVIAAAGHEVPGATVAQTGRRSPSTLSAAIPPRGEQH